MTRFWWRSMCSRWLCSTSSRAWDCRSRCISTTAISWRSRLWMASRKGCASSISSTFCFSASSTLRSSSASRYMRVTGSSMPPTICWKSWSGFCDMMCAMRRAMSRFSRISADALARDSPSSGRATAGDGVASTTTRGTSFFSASGFAGFLAFLGFGVSASSPASALRAPMRARCTPRTITWAPPSRCSTRVTLQMVPTSWSAARSGCSSFGSFCSTVQSSWSLSIAALMAARDAGRPTMSAWISSGKTVTFLSGSSGSCRVVKVYAPSSASGCQGCQAFKRLGNRRLVLGIVRPPR